MNLINDPWITVRRQSGAEGSIRPAQIAAGEETDPIVDILAPRPDFRGALYQFLIGLLQTTFAPEDIDDWKERWDKPPTVDELDKVFGAYAYAFELDAKGVAFMQDYIPSASEFVPLAAATPDMSIRVSAGSIGGVTQAQQSSSTLTAPVAKPRIDLIVVDATTANMSVITGVENTKPTVPVIPANKIAIGRIALIPGQTAITDSDITVSSDLSDSEQKNISSLLIEAPGENTLKENKDHFIKRESINTLCPCCTATALFTLQINAPSGGAGNRVSLRGGGPLTTLLIPAQGHDALWYKLWLNILPKDAFSQDELARKHGKLAATLPWMGPARTSAGKPAEETTPRDVEPLQAYWSMPRRVRIDFVHIQAGQCDACGKASAQLINQYQAKNYGTNYGGNWLHPLTPYRFGAQQKIEAEQKYLPISAKGGNAKNGYRHWASMILGGQEPEPVAAQTITHYHVQKFRKLNKMAASIWAFGFDMDNMKALCWYESNLPFFTHADGQFALQKKIQPMLDVAEEAARLLARAVRQAWGLDKKGDPQVQENLWQMSETCFYAVLREIAQANDLEDATLAPYYKNWILFIGDLASRCFDEWVLSAAIEEQNMIGVIEAREQLAKTLNNSRPVKALWERIDPERVIKKRLSKVGKARNAPAATTQTDLP